MAHLHPAPTNSQPLRLSRCRLLPASRRWLALAGGDVLRAPAFVLLWGQPLQLGLAAAHRLVENLLQKRDAPAAAGAGATALRQLAGDLRPGAAHEVDQLAAVDVKTIAD